MTAENVLVRLEHGGYAMLFIALCALVALAVAAERGIAWWGVVGQARRLANQVGKALLRGDHAQARSACERSRALMGDLFLAGFARQGQGAKDFAPAVERARTELLLKLKSHLWILGTLGSISPFVGLFGTVIGIQTAFKDMAAAGTGGFAVVASGIGAALETTAAGIFVAVIAVVLYNYFQARLGRVSAEIKLISDEFVELLEERPMPPPGTSAEPPSDSSLATAPAGT